MKNLFYLLMTVLFISTFSSCATIFGGSKYWAKVQVPDHPNAKIEYNGVYQGTGEASFMVKRKDADKVSVTVKEKGCTEQTSQFKQRTFRGWSFVGSLVCWTGMVPGTPIPLPWGIAIDGATGAWWKPDVNEKGVMKQDYKHYIYQIHYSGCQKEED
ncbi:MAG: hypothetical protein JXR71_02525 [Bacteroidales bacterium]|nr:hypothetical protein [Bacteroidales bacterium]